MARLLYGNTPADFTLSRSGKIVPNAPLTVWTAVEGGSQVTDLLDYGNAPVATVTSDDAGLVRFYAPDGTDATLWIQADSGGTRLAVRPVNLPTAALNIGTVTTGSADATLTPDGTDAWTLDLTLPSAGEDGVNTAAIQDHAVTVDKIAPDAANNGLVLTSDDGEESGMKWSAYGVADLDIGTVGTGTPAAASMTGNPEDGYELNLTLPPVGDGSITNIAVNAAANIGRSKIAGTALTKASTGVISVLDYGAKGDGVTDDTAAIQAAVNAAGSYRYPPETFGGKVLIPPTGHAYRIDGTIRIGQQVTVEIQAGATCQRFSAGTAATVPMFQIYGQVQSRLIGNGTLRTENASPNGVIAMGPIDPDIEDVRVYGAVVDGLTIYGLKASGNVGVALKSSNDLNPASGMYENVVSNLRLDAFGTGIWLSKGANANEFRNNCFMHILDWAYDLWGNGSGAQWYEVAQNRFFGGFLDGSPNATAIRLRSATQNYFFGFNQEPGWAAPYDNNPFEIDADSSQNIIITNNNTAGDGIDLGTDNIIILDGVFSGPSMVTAGGFGYKSGPTDTAGTGTPEGQITAPVGSTFRRDDGGAGTSLYVKESGTGNTGWVAKGGTGPTPFTIGTVGTGTADVTISGDEVDGYVLDFVVPPIPSGTGGPNGAVSATPGSLWLQTDSVTDIKGWILWRKASGTGNTGWVAGPEADTGWRDVTASLSSAGTTKYPNLKAAIRRFGKQVEMIVYTGASSVDGAASTIIYSIPTGFKPKALWTYRSPTGAMINASNGTPATAVGLYVGSGESAVIGQTATAGVGSSVVGSMTWGTEQAWPTSLPGVAA